MLTKKLGKKFEYLCWTAIKQADCMFYFKKEWRQHFLSFEILENKKSCGNAKRAFPIPCS